MLGGHRGGGVVPATSMPPMNAEEALGDFKRNSCCFPNSLLPLCTEQMPFISMGESSRSPTPVSTAFEPSWEYREAAQFVPLPHALAC